MSFFPFARAGVFGFRFGFWGGVVSGRVRWGLGSDSNVCCVCRGSGWNVCVFFFSGGGGFGLGVHGAEYINTYIYIYMYITY